MTPRDAIADIIFRRILAAEAEGFTLLRRIPSGSVVRYLKYCATLSADDRRAFHRGNAVIAAKYFGHPIDPMSVDSFARYRHHLNTTWDWDASDVRSLRMMRPILAQDPSSDLHQRLPAAIKARIASLETAKAKELRKVAKLAFAQLLGAKPRNEGEWIYAGKMGTDGVEVEIDYGGMCAQMRYHVRMTAFPTQGWGEPGYEAILGAGLGWWDLIEQGHEDSAFAVLCDAVRETVNIFREVYQSGYVKPM